MRWSDIRERALPADLATALDEQKAACASILSSKDALIAGLVREQTTKDEEYVAALTAQRTDIAALLDRMQAQFDELRDMYGSELEGIEAAFLAEREALLASTKKETDALFDQRRAMENRAVEDRIAREEACATELYGMQAADAENYSKLKVKLETDVAILEQQLEHMRYVYLLNTEKLEYNYRVLTERDNESKATLAAQKARLARLRASLAKVQADYEASDAKFKARNDALTNEYQRTTRAYRDLQAKYRHFEAADTARYAAVVSVHEEEMRSMAARLLSADRVITEQLLGVEWAPPAEAAAVLQLDGMDGGATAAAAGGMSTTMGGDAGTARHAGSSGGGGEAGERSSPAAAGAVGHAGAAASSDGAVAIDGRKLRPLLTLLVAECGPFLVDSGTREACERLDAAGKRDAADALRADAILRTIGAETEAAVAGLVESVENALAEAGSTEGDAAFSLALTREDGLPILPPGFTALSAVRTWIEAVRAGGGGVGGGGIDAIRAIEAAQKAGEDEGGATLAFEATSATGGGAGAAATAGGAGGRSRPVADADFWRRFEHAVPPSRIRIWKALEAGMAKYESVLRKRSVLVAEVEALEKGNGELRSLLAYYLSQPQSTELQVPPGATLRIGPHTNDILSLAATALVSGVVQAPPAGLTAGVTGMGVSGKAATGGAKSMAKSSTAAAEQQHQQQQQRAGGTAASSVRLSGLQATALYRPK
jgi:dynein regulatry complex protein 1